MKGCGVWRGEVWRDVERWRGVVCRGVVWRVAVCGGVWCGEMWRGVECRAVVCVGVECEGLWCVEGCGV